MNLTFSDQAWEDYPILAGDKQETGAAEFTNYSGTSVAIRTPELASLEPLRHSLAGWWSRRIDQEHRLVYRVTEQGVLLAQMRYHY